MTAKKTVAKPAAKKVAPKVETPAAKESLVLYTFRLAPSLVAGLNAVGKKKNVTHAEVARDAIAAYLKNAA